PRARGAARHASPGSAGAKPVRTGRSSSPGRPATSTRSSRPPNAGRWHDCPQLTSPRPPNAGGRQDAPQRTPPPAAPTGLTHACARCGAPVPLDVGLCEKCNPLGLRDVASSQAHGTVFLGIGVAVVVLMVGALLGVRGIGPFSAQVVAFQPDGDAIRVSL